MKVSTSVWDTLKRAFFSVSQRLLSSSSVDKNKNSQACNQTFSKFIFLYLLPYVFLFAAFVFLTALSLLSIHTLCMIYIHFFQVFLLIFETLWLRNSKI